MKYAFAALITLFICLTGKSADVSDSVVTVVISHAQYPNLTDDKLKLGLLGDYLPANQVPNDQLDLSLPLNLARNQVSNGILVGVDLVVVPYHSLEGSTKIYVHTHRKASANTENSSATAAMYRFDEGSYANIHAADVRSDLAVLKLLKPFKNTPTAKLGKAWLPKQDEAVSLAASVGCEKPKIVKGTVQEIDTKIQTNEPPGFAGNSAALPFPAYSTLIRVQSTASNCLSGGAIFSESGELIGMTTSLVSTVTNEESLGLAMPFDLLYQPILKRLIQGKEVEYGFLGISWMQAGGGFGGFGGGRGRGRFGPGGGFQPQQENLEGVAIGNVMPGLPASEAGLQSGDVLLSVNRKKINSQNDMQIRIAGALANHTTKMKIRRASTGKEETVTVNLVKANNPMSWIASQNPKPIFGLHVDHRSTLLQDLMQVERDQSPLYSIPQGVIVSKTDADSPASKIFTDKFRKYIIMKVNGVATPTLDEFHEQAQNKKSLQLTVSLFGNRPSQTFEVNLP